MKNKSVKLSCLNKIVLPKSSRRVLNLKHNDRVKFINDNEFHVVQIEKDSSSTSNSQAPKWLITFDTIMAWGFILFFLQLLPVNSFTKLCFSFLSSSTLIFPLFYPGIFKRISIKLAEILGVIFTIAMLFAVITSLISVI